MPGPRVLQLMMRVGGSTASIGELVSRELTGFTFLNCYLQGKPSGDAVSMQLSGRLISGVLRYLAVLLMRWRLRYFQPDVILAHRFKCLHIGMLLARLFRCPLLVVVHGTGEYDRPYRRRLLLRALRQGSRVVCVSAYVRRYVLGVLGPGFDDRVIVIENAIDYARVAARLLPRIEARARLLGADSDDMLIGYVGRLVSVKGVQDLVQAVCRLRRERVRLVIVGDGPLRESLEETLRREQCPLPVVFAGFVPEAVRLFRGLDLLVMPSYSEGFPIALLEALAADVPVLVSDIDVYRDILGETDCFYRAGDVDALACGLDTCIDAFARGELAARWSQEAARLRALHPYAAFIRGYQDVLASVLDHEKIRP